MNKFKIKTEVRFSDNAIDTLLEFSDVNAVIITDRFMVESGTAARISDKLTACRSVHIFSDVVPDPPIELIARGLSFLQKTQADIVVALGGGSSIDAAKSMVFLANRISEGRRLRLIAIPTTSGTGSEVTQFAVITDKSRGIKYPLVDEGLLPDLAILDPSLTLTVPPSVTADTGFDVITHALEAYISTMSNDASDALAEKALCIAFAYLPITYRDGSNLKAREKMHSASCLAGMSFNEVGLGINHAIAHALGAKFHIPHGRANAMLLPHVVAFNADLKGNFGAEHYSEAALRIAEISRKLNLPAQNIRMAITSFIDEIEYMLEQMQVPRTLGAAGVEKNAFEAQRDAVIEAALQDTCAKTNPRPATARDVGKLLDKIAVW